MSEQQLYWLDPATPDTPFPSPQAALEHPNGLLAAGGDLSVPRLRAAYAHGIFPWYEPGEPILWWSPDPRTVFQPDGIHVSKRLARTLNRNDYRITFDTAFEAVIDGCAQPRGDSAGTWISTDMRAAYLALHRAGDAHAIEVWRQGRLISGLYGVASGTVFFGESMFSRERDASKIALVWLGRQLAAWGFELLDGQIGSPHLYRMGAFDMPRRQFLATLEQPAPAHRAHDRWHFELETDARC
ncbi:leucyl/phenylalanyl-tRNA--protein transferase [Salinisphaera sp. USBA-960]|uniref:leucyl/phenylalanyl-tRNA--protein transferase n=1 Tax=Salinisphaera orenii TaxID=856731 RepID=UPI000DBE9317|nr:leucyl/phenylalanyl-tRNA--protein transferase [Salifodinibacter halophilus]NNC25839.1 leucyl/phenylalanyl-tRNA--protein transferase [Salifodinibacter halophilus]